MENILTKYQGKNYKDALEKLEVISDVSKEGKPYSCIQLTFVNGYQTRLFARGGDAFAIANAFDSLQLINQMDTNF